MKVKVIRDASSRRPHVLDILSNVHNGIQSIKVKGISMTEMCVREDADEGEKEYNLSAIELAHDCLKSVQQMYQQETHTEKKRMQPKVLVSDLYSPISTLSTYDRNETPQSESANLQDEMREFALELHDALLQLPKDLQDELNGPMDSLCTSPRVKRQQQEILDKKRQALILSPKSEMQMYAERKEVESQEQRTKQKEERLREGAGGRWAKSSCQSKGLVKLTKQQTNNYLKNFTRRACDQTQVDPTASSPKDCRESMSLIMPEASVPKSNTAQVSSKVPMVRKKHPPENTRLVDSSERKPLKTNALQQKAWLHSFLENTEKAITSKQERRKTSKMEKAVWRNFRENSIKRHTERTQNAWQKRNESKQVEHFFKQKGGHSAPSHQRSKAVVRLSKNKVNDAEAMLPNSSGYLQRYQHLQSIWQVEPTRHTNDDRDEKGSGREKNALAKACYQVSAYVYQKRTEMIHLAVPHAACLWCKVAEAFRLDEADMIVHREVARLDSVSGKYQCLEVVHKDTYRLQPGDIFRITNALQLLDEVEIEAEIGKKEKEASAFKPNKVDDIMGYPPSLKSLDQKAFTTIQSIHRLAENTWDEHGRSVLVRPMRTSDEERSTRRLTSLHV